MEKVDYILTADWHLRDTVPACRKDDFWRTQWKKVKYVSNLQKKYDCPVLHAGDLFDHWRTTPYLLSKTIECLPDKFYTVYGNHDLPYHNLENSDKSGVMVLERAGRIKVLNHKTDPMGLNFGVTPALCHENTNCYVWHQYVWTDGCSHAMADPDEKAENLLATYFDGTSHPTLVLTGDNHTPFTYRRGNVLLVNPGPLTRQKADDKRPRVYLYNKETGELLLHYIPTSKRFVTREHLDVQLNRLARVNTFIEKLNDDWTGEMDLTEQLKNTARLSKIEKPVMDIIYRAIGD